MVGSLAAVCKGHQKRRFLQDWVGLIHRRYACPRTKHSYSYSVRFAWVSTDIVTDNQILHAIAIEVTSSRQEVPKAIHIKVKRHTIDFLKRIVQNRNTAVDGNRNIGTIDTIEVDLVSIGINAANDGLTKTFGLSPTF